MARYDHRKRRPKRRTYPPLVTALAKSQHKIWVEWMSYLFGQCTQQERPILDFDAKEDQGNKNHLDDMPTMKGKETLLVIPADVVADAQKLIKADWDDLSLEQQEAFQDEVKTILRALQEYGEELIASMEPAEEEEK